MMLEGGTAPAPARPKRQLRDRHDVAVVGAGPAGSAAARELARAGARVVLLEARPLPRYKTCGGGLVPRALAGMPSSARAAVERECTAVDVSFARPGESLACERVPPLISMAMRAPLDHALGRAAAAAGAAVRDGCTVTALEQSGDRVTVRTTAGAVRVRFVVVADGATGRVARMAGWPAHAQAIPAVEFEATPADADFERLSRRARFDFDFLPNGYAWVFPKREHLSIGVLCVHRGQTGLRDWLDRYLTALGLSADVPGERHGNVIPLRPRSELVRGRVILAGDAAGFADPVTAEGISNALVSGRLAAAAVLEGDADPGAVRTAYARRLRVGITDELRLARVVARVLYHSRTGRDFLVRHRGQMLADAVAKVFAGEETWRSLMLRAGAWARLLAGTTTR